MDRPQEYRRWVPPRWKRWRFGPEGINLGLRYHTLDVAEEDVENFYAVSVHLGSIQAETISYAEWRRRRGVETKKRERISHHVAFVEEYLKLKAWRVRLRHASGDLEWAFEPYRKEAASLLAKRQRKSEASRKSEKQRKPRAQKQWRVGVAKRRSLPPPPPWSPPPRSILPAHVPLIPRVKEMLSCMGVTVTVVWWNCLSNRERHKLMQDAGLV